MRVLMLGWEFPPFISGGLGTACYGLTKALAGPDLEITFVLPKHVDEEYQQHVKVLSPQAPEAAQGSRAPDAVASTYAVDLPAPELPPTPAPGPAASETPPQQDPFVAKPAEAFDHVTFKAVPSKIYSPYPTAPPKNGSGIGFLHSGGGQATSTPPPPPPSPAPSEQKHNLLGGGGDDYGGDLIGQAYRYADLCLDMVRDQEFDVIHAHDWLTFPAGEAVARATGKPLIVHVHSTEFDRAGEGMHEGLAQIERQGLIAADRVIAVSHLTRQVLESRYSCPSDKIEVVYNGIENGKTPTKTELPAPASISKDDKVVLFLGRITMQKGPEYFVQAAKRVLEKMDNVKFVMAGTGDKVREVIELAAKLGIGHKVLFTGFLRGDDVKKVFEMADVFVMPSVSEPFGIAPLEAIAHDVPVIISTTSGVSEVLQHVLKVDFWDIDEMANKIVAVLKYPPLGVTLRQHADLEARRLTWRQAADACREIYEQVM